MNTSFESLLKFQEVANILPEKFQFGRALVVDLSRTSKIWQQAAAEKKDVDTWVLSQMAERQAVMSIGRYNEQRPIYENTEQFADTPSRDLHIGLDLGVPSGTPCFSPLKATVHSVADHQHQGDYGPTVILRHQIEKVVFFTLFGHLASETLSHLTPGQTLAAGELLGWVGEKSENGGWAPHLHLQIIKELGEYTDDYPGVAFMSDSEYMLANCPNPNLLIRRDDI
ncbi:peptidoglycan DD-metalloendopeptidase family protein [Veronia pacifica]|uniref:M23ase beta-sheet core domain-containing protein n=1 Tax=Veronia pacifica TaxID=1080227 RepID=A0A1C3ESM4_9GAMM|nr:peptidoglycan DD-metalloendopeptidase family protein [Veronia pacifica]ODA36218.1 hypothetical protein A8L45_01035 [Veronia pacifica]